MFKKDKKSLKQKIINKRSGVFLKIFAYTMLLVMLICAAAVFLFSREFLLFYRTEQRRQLTTSFQPIITAITARERSPEEIAEVAERFADNNQSFRFIIRGDEGIIFSTVNIEELSEEDDAGRVHFNISSRIGNSGENISNFYFTGYSIDSGNIDYSSLAVRIMLALAIMLAIAVLGAVLFAKRVTRPLEDEIVRRSLMEENQRLFFSAASHELKTPVAAARALVEGMIAGVGDYKDHHKYLRECLKTLDSQGHLVSEILDIVKLSDNEIKLSFDNINLGQLGSSVLSEYRPLAENKGIKIIGEFPDIDISADFLLLKKVFSNITANAVQNTKEGGEIRIFSEKNKKFRICILNTGAKIPDDILSRLFEPFYRRDTARTGNGRNGLGLTIVKKALDRMNFPFGLDNTDSGALFWIDLPLEI